MTGVQTCALPILQAEGVTGELGFVTEKISESDCEKKEAELGNVLQKIRVA